jgi:glycerol-3-phosphate responsive antiterminator
MSIKKTEKEKKIETVDITFFLDVFLTMAWAFCNKIKSDLIDIFPSIICVICCIPNSLN